MRLLFSVFTLITTTCAAQQVSIIPQPLSIKYGKGTFTLSKKTVLAARDEADRKTANLFNDYLQQVYGFKLDVDKQEGKDYIRLTTRKFIKAPDKDAYVLDVSRDGITIEGDTYEGTFYGIQTLIQLLPVDNTSSSSLTLPLLTVMDAPRFSYRGMHLDVCRHFFPVSFVKKYIDYLALHKMNYFHWHLTDDQGWRIEIKKYPELQTRGAWRNGTIIGRYPGTGNDNTRYGGFYTQDEVKEIVQYAADRHITVLPEIEMPGHASAAIAAYPWLSCFPQEPTKIPSHPSEGSIRQQANGTPKQVQESWGVYEDVFCAGKDSTFLFLEGVMDEVLQLFPSTYIHVGGDESPKVNWKRCPNCQARMKAQGLKDEHELQSYFIQRMEKYLNAKGRTLIGWDEILEGGLAPNAVVMSWRGEEGGIAAARQNHYVIMTPSKPVYFDYSQTKNEDSLVIGGYNPIEQVYAYEPVPGALDTSKAKYIMGAQANVWTEYMAYPSKVEYMIFPRMSALSEVLWSEKKNRNWMDFERRLQSQFTRYDLWKVSHSKAYFDINASILPAKNYKGVIWKLETKSKDGKIIYQDPASHQSRNYVGAIPISKSGQYQAFISSKGQYGPPLNQAFSFNKATGKKVSITNKPNEKYPGQPGAFSLVNGIYSNKGLSYSDWVGFIGDDLVATIDLGTKTTIDSVRMHTLDQNGSWIYLPKDVEVLLSTDGKIYKSVGRSTKFVKDTLTMGWITVTFPRKSARYIKLIAKNYGTIPDGLPGGGNKAWLFADEVQVY